MDLNTKTGVIEQAVWLESPNCDDRPEGVDISLIVIHGISLPPGRFGGQYIERLFTNQLDPGEHPYFENIAGMRVSSHFLIRRDGELIQFVPVQKRAWHAGESCFCGRSHCNDFSIGIELEGTDDVVYTDIQYEKLARLIQTLTRVYSEITRENIVGHCDIAPGRKTDPGAVFDWARLQQQLSDNLAS